MKYLSLAVSLTLLAGPCLALDGARPAPTQPPLSSPIGPGGALPAGSGPGVFSPNSAFAPLVERADVVPWSVLTAVKTKLMAKRLLPVFPSDVQAMDKKTQRIQGYMMPLSPGEKQQHFILSSVPLTCSFCFPGGPESMVEVRTKKPIKYALEAVVVEGTFAVLSDDPQGLYYRMTEAVSVK